MSTGSYALGTFCLIMLTIKGASQDMNYFLLQELKGVKSMTLENSSATTDHASKVKRTEFYLFSSSGKIISFKAMENDKTYLSVDYTYDSNDRLLSEMHSGEQGNKNYQYSYTTDTAGNLTTKKTENGKLIYESREKKTTNGFSFVDYYDSNGNEINQEYHDKNGKIIRNYYYGTGTQAEYRYDDHGNMITTRTTNENGRSASVHFTNKYTNNKIESISTKGNVISFSYDKDGRLSTLTDQSSGMKTVAAYTLF